MAKTFFYSQGNGVSEDLFGKVMALATEGIEKILLQKKRQYTPSLVDDEIGIHIFLICSTKCIGQVLMNLSSYLNPFFGVQM